MTGNEVLFLILTLENYVIENFRQILEERKNLMQELEWTK